MQVSWRRLSPRELDHELLWLSVSLGVLVAAATWFAGHLPWPRCIFRAVTGFPCLTCGATRCAIAFLHGNFANAWMLNPLTFAVLCALALFDFYAFIVLVTQAPRLRIANLTRVEKIAARILIFTFLGLNWTWVLQHSTAFGT